MARREEKTWDGDERTVFPVAGIGGGREGENGGGGDEIVDFVAEFSGKVKECQARFLRAVCGDAVMARSRDDRIVAFAGVRSR